MSPGQAQRGQKVGIGTILKNLIQFFYVRTFVLCFSGRTWYDWPTWTTRPRRTKGKNNQSWLIGCIFKISQSTHVILALNMNKVLHVV